MPPAVAREDARRVSAAPLNGADDECMSQRVLTWEEIKQHSTADDAWIAIKGRVYDVTQFKKLHPGGDIILTFAGLDATDVFAAFHAGTSAWQDLPSLCVGVVKGSALPKLANHEYMEDVQEMRRDLQKLRLFESSKLYYAFKILSTTAICLLSIAMLLAAPSSPPVVIVSAIILALFWQQCGWLAHDFLHHQVFINRGWNNIGGLLIGNLYQGFSVNWWKNKHNHHHAVPNVTDTPSGGDPDIATMPILFWSEKLFEGEDLDKLPKWMLRNQWFLYWPILCMARVSWLIQSAQYQLEVRNPNVTSLLMYIAELSILAIHHLLYLALLSNIPSWSLTILFTLISQSLGGLFIGIVFTVGHNAMEVFTEEELRSIDFVRLQVKSTRDVTPHWFTDWFCGGLNYQVEHHIWPTIPRHNLPKAAKILQNFCLKHDIPYAMESLVEGNRQVCQLLAKLSHNAKKLSY